jgi:hypothetical protein
VHTVAVFVADDYTDVLRARAWAKQQTSGLFVLLTDDPTDVVTAIARQLRCEQVVHAHVRVPSQARGLLTDARSRRAEAMVAIANRVVLFGDEPFESEPWKERLRFADCEQYRLNGLTIHWPGDSR